VGFNICGLAADPLFWAANENDNTQRKKAMNSFNGEADSMAWKFSKTNIMLPGCVKYTKKPPPIGDGLFIF
jgi:hypothetical protein